LSFINDILRYESISIVGLAKNTGKTECFNYILGKIKDKEKCVALTSIGLDGENCDQVTQTHKPEIEIYEKMLFVTSEKHFREKNLIAEILDVSNNQTSLGRLVTAKAVNEGKVLLSGPADTRSLQRLIHSLKKFGTDLAIVDGALSRLSLASPTITDAMILTTGAAVSKNIPQLVRQTKYVYDLINLDIVDKKLHNELHNIKNGIWAVAPEGNVHNLNIISVFAEEQLQKNIFEYGTVLFVSGAISDRFIKFLEKQKQIKEIVLIIRDFTKVFASMESYYSFIKKGGQLKVLHKSKLIAVCINPVSPDGYIIDSDKLKDAMEQSLGIPVYDVRRVNS